MVQFSNVYLALGANLGNTRETFFKGIADIQSRVGDIRALSSFHETSPLNHPDTPTLLQPNYLNAVLICSSSLAAEKILEIVQTIERQNGRNRAAETRWGPRTLDIDIIAVDNAVVNTQALSLPHPEMHKRSFVLAPMLEIAPEWEHPLLRKRVAALLSDLA